MFNLFNKKVGRIVQDVHQGGNDFIDFSKVYYFFDKKSDSFVFATKDIIKKDDNMLYHTEESVINTIVTQIKNNKKYNENLFNKKLFFYDYRTGKNLLKKYQEKNKIITAWLEKGIFKIFLKDAGLLQICIHEYTTNIDEILNDELLIDAEGFFKKTCYTHNVCYPTYHNQVLDTIKKIEEKLNEKNI